jgi:flagellum-specific peptidoglycan hydrolase FlgJ
MADAWRDQVGSVPARASLLVLMAQWGLETGSGRACMNWNLAGIKHVPGDGHDYAEYRTHEVLHGVDQVLVQQFRAYPSLEAGVADYLHVLRSTFGFAWPAVEAGDTADFAHRLKARGYFTADEAQYAAGLRARYQQMAAAVPESAPAPAPPDHSDLLSEAETVLDPAKT